MKDVIEAMIDAALDAEMVDGDRLSDWLETTDFTRESLRVAMRAALSAALERGYRLVPVEPTADVARAVHDTFAAEDEDRKMLFMGIWLRGHRAMIAASPEVK